MSSYRDIMTSAFSKGALVDISDLQRLVYKPRISSNMFSFVVMQRLHTKVDDVQVAASNFKISSADTESASLIRGVGGRFSVFS
jgi:hypothetical protein